MRNLKIWGILTVIVMLAFTACQDSPGGGGDGDGIPEYSYTFEYELGDFGPGGGIIFYRSAVGFTVYQNATDTVGTTCHYLEVSKALVAGLNTWASAAFKNTNIVGTKTEIGSGKKNTALILATDANASAATACNQYSNNGKTDWFMPSVDELIKLWENRACVSGKEGVASIGSDNWSSSQALADMAYVSNNLGGANAVLKTTGRAVRAIRAF